jgi:hypothetical protein
MLQNGLVESDNLSLGDRLRVEIEHTPHKLMEGLQNILAHPHFALAQPALEPMASILIGCDSRQSAVCRNYTLNLEETAVENAPHGCVVDVSVNVEVCLSFGVLHAVTTVEEDLSQNTLFFLFGRGRHETGVDFCRRSRHHLRRPASGSFRRYSTQKLRRTVVDKSWIVFVKLFVLCLEFAQGSPGLA